MCCVGNDHDLRAVTTGADGAFSGIRKGATFVDHTTASAEIARELDAEATKRGFKFVDAPVSGGQAGAENVWFENLLVAIATTLRILAHRVITRKRGHWRVDEKAGIKVNDKPYKSTLLGSYALIAFVFTLAHGVFVAAIAFMLTQNHPDDPTWQLSWPQLWRGVAVISAMLGVELVVDLATMRTKSFA